MGSNRDRRPHLPRTPVFPIYFSGLKNLRKIVLAQKNMLSLDQYLATDVILLPGGVRSGVEILVPFLHFSAQNEMSCYRLPRGCKSMDCVQPT